MHNNIFNLNNYGYIVTGGLGFLGKEHCKAIAAFGGQPIAIDLNIKDSDSLKDEIFEKYKINLITYESDITNENDLKYICKDIEKKVLLKGLVNNAARNPQVKKDGLIDNSRIENFSLEEWNKDLNIGLTGSFLATKIFGDFMNKNKGGSIVNISSDLGLISPKQSLYTRKGVDSKNQPVKPITYSVVKTGLIGMTRYTSTYWPKKVRCNCLCPGGVFNNQSEEFLEKVNSEIPLSRLANKDEYAGILIYLLSSASSYMNGAILSIDGGRTTW